MKKTTVKKIAKAEEILQEEKEELFQMVTARGIDCYGSLRDFLSIIEEDAKYRMRALGLPEDLLKHYLNKICDIYGPYSGDQPGKKTGYYDNDLYLP